jgi:hypothetical protein
LQSDTLIPDPTNPQAWNRYSYVINNPIKYDNPTGHCFDGCVLEIGMIATFVAPEIVIPILAELTLLAIVIIAVKKWRQNTANQKQVNSLVTSSYTSGKNNLGPGYGYTHLLNAV